MRARLWMHYPAYRNTFLDVWEREQQRAALRERLDGGSSLAELAREVGVGEGTLRAFLRGVLPMTRVACLLRDWSGDDPHHVPAGTVAFSAAAECFPTDMQREVRRTLCRMLVDAYAARGLDVHPWMAEGLER